MVPQVSVVVPTRDRPDGLRAALAALAAQTLDPERFEVLVVDDGSTPPAAVDPGPPAVRVLRHDVARGPAAARNAGWRAARAPLVAFTDDDCTASPGWLEALLAAGAGGEAVVQGPVAPARPGEVRPLSHTIDMPEPNPFFVTCNVAYPRRLLERLGGFDEAFPAASGEDVDLGTRAVDAGAPTRFARDALVLHEVRQPTLRELVRHTTRWDGSVRAVALHPRLREHLVWRLFWKPTHPRLLLALAGAASRRPLLRAAGVAAYLDHYRRLYRDDPAAGVRELPRHVVVDLAEVLTMVRGSLRHRTPML